LIIHWPLLLTAIAIGVYSAAFHRLLQRYSRNSKQAKPQWYLIWGGAILFTLIWHSQGIWRRFENSTEDSFFTLDNWQRQGLLIVSTSLIAIFFFLSAIKTKWFLGHDGRIARRGRSVCFLDLVATCGLFALLYPLAAQVYYAYYQAIIPGLPNQWVVKSGIDSSTASAFSLAGSNLSLNRFLATMTIWTAVSAVIWQHLGVSARHQNKTHALVIGLLFAAANYTWLYFSLTAV